MRLKAIFGSVLLALGAYAGYWYYIAYYAEEYVLDRADDLAAVGIDFEYDAVEVSGFPYRLVLDFTDARFQMQQGDLRITWQAPYLQTIAQPWNFRHLILFSETPLIRLQTGDDKTNGFTLQPRFLQASYRTDTTGTQKISFVAEDVQIAASGKDTAVTSKSTALHIRLFDTRGGSPETAGLIGTPLANVALNFKGLNILSTESAAPDRNAGSDLDIELTPRGPFLPRLTPYSLAAWRDAGSTIEIEEVRIKAANGVTSSANNLANNSANDLANNWIAWGDGSVSLDAQLRPLGALSLHADNTDNLLAWLAGIGLIESGDLSEIQAAARTLHAMLGQGADPIVPITLQGGFLSVGPIPVMPLKPLVGGD